MNWNFCLHRNQERKCSHFSKSRKLCKITAVTAQPVREEEEVDVEDVKLLEGHHEG